MRRLGTYCPTMSYFESRCWSRRLSSLKGWRTRSAWHPQPDYPRSTCTSTCAGRRRGTGAGSAAACASSESSLSAAGKCVTSRAGIRVKDSGREHQECHLQRGGGTRRGKRRKSNKKRSTSSCQSVAVLSTKSTVSVSNSVSLRGKCASAQGKSVFLSTSESSLCNRRNQGR